LASNGVGELITLHGDNVREVMGIGIRAPLNWPNLILGKFLPKYKRGLKRGKKFGSFVAI